jgi:hypothetical protein
MFRNRKKCKNPRKEIPGCFRDFLASKLPSIRTSSPSGIFLLLEFFSFWSFLLLGVFFFSEFSSFGIFPFLL